ncbi:MAG TPA: permease prefix domain 1-containing protein [Pyrinomonadaceae bacterium]|nr:permease prefix domain 1-containing protein [Pyrinomonadaceae bacterium]
MKVALRNLLARLNRNKTAFEVEEELQFHIEMLERNYAQEGMSDAHARAAALRRFGNFERIKKQCLDISLRNTLLRRVLKASSILIALTGLVIRVSSTDYKVARLGTVIIMVAISGRLLLYVRGLSPWTYLSGTEKSLSVVGQDSQKLTRLPQK